MSETKVGTAYVEVVPKVDKGFKERVKGQLPNESDGGKSGRGLMAGMKGAVGAGAVALGNIMSNVATDAAGKLAETFSSAFTGFADYEQLTGGVEKLFGADAAKTVQENAEKAFQTAGMSANQYMEQATSFSASLINSLGGDTQKAAELTDVAMRAMSDNVNTFGSDMGSVQNAFQGFAKGQYNMLDNLKLGYGGTKAEMEKLIADANEYAAANGEAADLSIDSFADIVQAIELIQEKQNVAGTTAKEAASTVEGSINQAKAAWENWLTALGRDDVDLGAVTDQLVQSLETAASNAIPVVGRIVESIGTTLINNGPLLYDNALIAFTQIATAAPDVIPQAIAGIGVLVAQAASTLIGDAPKILAGALKMFFAICTGLWQAAPKVISAILEAVPKFAETLSGEAPSILEAAKGLFNAIGQGLAEIVPKLIEALGYIVTHLPDIIIGGASAMAEGAATLFDSFVGGFLGKQPDVEAEVASATDDVVATATEHADASPVSEELSSSIMEGYDWSQFEAKTVEGTQSAIDAAALTADAAPITKQMADSAKSTVDQNAMDDGSKAMVENAVKAAESVDSSSIGQNFSEKAAGGIDTNAMADRISSAASAASTSVKVGLEVDTSGVKQLSDAASGIAGSYSSAAARASASLNSISAAASSGASAVAGSAAKAAASLQTIASTAQSVAASVRASISSIPSSKTVTISFSTPHIPVPHYSISGTLDAAHGHTPTVSAWWGAEGGILTKATIFGAGEAGPEAVLPLTKLEKMLDESNGKYSGGNVYNVTVNARTDASAGDIAAATARKLKLMNMARGR